jgi:CYTH domain-containing protein
LKIKEYKFFYGNYKDMNEEKIAQIVFRRTFLTEGLPGEMTPANSHLQLFDNYIEGTRIRLRKIRLPETREWTRSLEQIVPDEAGRFGFSQIVLNETEYDVFQRFEGREIRKNRYFYETAGETFEIDIYLGKLWGLNIAAVYFESEEDRNDFEPPDFAVLEITADEFFNGANLVAKEFADIQDRLTK